MKTGDNNELNELNNYGVEVEEVVDIKVEEAINVPPTEGIEVSETPVVEKVEIKDAYREEIS